MKHPQSQQSSSTLLPGYVLPMAAFMVLTALEGFAPSAYYVWLYALKCVVVTATLFWFRRTTWQDIQPSVRVLIPAVVVGLAVFGQWILLDKLIPYPHLGSRIGLNPFSTIESPVVLFMFLTVRFYGLAVMVPVMEELFWRSFLLRYMTDPDFTKLPLGTFSWQAFAIVAGMFGLLHSEWLVAIICACAYGLLLRQTKSIFACIIAHGVTNLALGIYVLVARDWIYW